MNPRKLVEALASLGQFIPLTCLITLVRASYPLPKMSEWLASRAQGRVG